MSDEFMSFDLDDVHLLDTSAKIALPLFLKPCIKNPPDDMGTLYRMFSNAAECSYRVGYEMLKAKEKLLAELEAELEGNTWNEKFKALSI